MSDMNWSLKESHSFDRNTIAEIRRAAQTGASVDGDSS